MKTLSCAAATAIALLGVLYAGAAQAVLMVDGGPTRNEQLMQFQADIIGVPVQRNDTAELSAMGAAYLAGSAQHGINGLIVIGMPVIEMDDRMNGARALEKIRLPVLDLYGSRDLDTVLRSAQTRSAAARKAENTAYRQTEVEGADHFFLGMDDELTRRIYGWLKSHFDRKP